jgi:hypothetical protein
MDALLHEIGGWAAARADVHAAVLVGSQARTDTPADEYSDADVVLFVDDPAPYVESAAWLEAFGTPLLTFIEGTATRGQLERRVLFESGLDVDFALVSTTAIPQLLSDRETAGAIARGFRILDDELDLAGASPASSPTARCPTSIGFPMTSGTTSCSQPRSSAEARSTTRSRCATATSSRAS